MATNARILGFNSPSALVAAGDDFLLGAGGGIVIRRKEESSQWIPCEGRYAIGALAFSPSAGLLCVTEVKLDVSLHVFRFPERHHLQCIDNVATVDVQHMLFSSDGEMLALLTCIPTTCVTFYSAARGNRLVKCASTELGGVFCKHLTFPLHRHDCIAVLEPHGVRIACNMDSATFVPSILTLSSKGHYFHSCVWGTEGLYCGAGRGQVVLLDELRTDMKNCINCETPHNVTALLQNGTLLFIGTECGDVFTYNIDQKAQRLLVRLGRSVVRLLTLPDVNDVLVATSTDVTKISVDTAQSVFVRRRSASDTVKLLVLGGLVVIVCLDGSLVTYDQDTNTAVHTPVRFPEKVVDACVVDSVVVVVYDSGFVRSFTVENTVSVVSQMKVSDCPLTACTSDGVSLLAVCDKNVVHFIEVADGLLETAASSDIFACAVTNLRWAVNGGQSVLAACNNGEVHNLRFTGKCDSASAGVTVDMTWRLDFPVNDFLPLYGDGDVINVFVHSVDKDTKMYALERQRVKESKPLRPYFLMRDHECGGNVLQRLGGDSIISAGGDGRVVVRDISHYLMKLPPVPPTKEKKHPLKEFLLRPFGRGGITCLSVWNAAGGFVCGGNDSVVHLVPVGKSPIHYSWSEPFWHQRAISTSPSRASSPSDAETLSAERSRCRIISALADLRMEVEKLLQERTPTVRAEDFLLPEQRQAFNEECEVEIHKAREDDYYSLVHNEFVQHTIKTECWDVMEVQRSKIVSMTDPETEVHNFHLRKPCAQRAKIQKKIKLMRAIQIKTEECFTLSSLVKRAKEGNLCTEQQVCGPPSDVDELLYDTLDVYTGPRATIQLILLECKILHEKKSFNIRFDTLRERKSRELNLIAERNGRCVRIMQQLGEHTCPPNVLFTPVFDIEEDPQTVFEVFDSEIDPELLKLAVKSDDGELVVSPSDEAALKTWMDGLEKVTEVLRVNVPIPPFADNSLEQYVPPEERSDEQQRIFEEYEKEVAEQTVLINEKKELLRGEVAALVKANMTSAKAIDDEIDVLRTDRMLVAQLVDELELHQVNALCLFLLKKTIRNKFLGVKREEEDLLCRLRQLDSLYEYRLKLYLASEARVQDCIEEEKNMITDMRCLPPFTDPDWGERLNRRFTTWRSKYEDGLAKVPEPTRSGVVPIPLWEQYCQCCRAVVEARDKIIHFRGEADALNDEVVEVETEKKKAQFALDDKEKAEEACRKEVIEKVLDIQNLYTLQQGQVQDENAMVSDDFTDFSIRWVKNITDYNDLIFASFDEIRSLMSRSSQLRQSMKTCSWETERLLYCIGTLEMELRQLHTLRVTRQMQETIHTGAVTSLEREINKMDARIEAVRSVMSKKVEERNRVISKLKMQINDRRAENQYLNNQVQALTNSVEDKKAVWGMLGEHNNDKDRLRERMRELYENSELEELARCQQEELVRLKNEVDRLREATFPSFAVVTRRTAR
ncbi:hypothetical protein DPX39_040047900 [Trypanosoma brucei equiperdum]|uniref:Cilia- and flagella-associated protein 43 n=1 Tax=Trypanosoma brucei equiperdum TaxID=630700 RepID=A0A3L6LC18_9TRYP|nr:hypothetical protein DPX39_040047900 [Trypanosoma brucei equiperdum]